MRDGRGVCEGWKGEWRGCICTEANVDSSLRDLLPALFSPHVDKLLAVLGMDHLALGKLQERDTLTASGS